MITLYIIGLIIKMSLWLLLLPFKIILFPFRGLFGPSEPKSKSKPARHRTYEDGLWDGLIIGDLLDDD